METTLIAPDDEATAIRIPMTKARFLNWNPDDDFLYEFDNATVEPVVAMKKAERPIVQKILRKFTQTQAYQQMGELLPETNVWLTDTQMRIPDIAFFTKEQIQVADDNNEPIPVFVVELISPTDKASKVEQKVREYFAAGVQVIWHIHPTLQMVRVFTSLKSSTTYFENDIVDAGPVLPDLQLVVNDLFAQ